MNKTKNKVLLFLLVAIAAVILIGVGATFAYFTATINSDEDAVSVTAAEFKIDLDDDTSLIKTNVIPSAEEYVDIASKRVDEDGNFLKPYNDQETGKLITDKTTCIDDNLNEICSIYTFTIINTMANDIPLYITLNPSINTFENLYYKVLDSNLNEVIEATRLVDDRPYTMNGEEKVYDSTASISPVVLEGINNVLPKSTDSENPSKVTYSIVIWIMETGENQTEADSGKIFAATLNVKASGAGGNGITGVISAAGTE